MAPGPSLGPARIEIARAWRRSVAHDSLQPGLFLTVAFGHTSHQSLGTLRAPFKGIDGAVEGVHEAILAVFWALSSYTPLEPREGPNKALCRDS